MQDFETILTHLRQLRRRLVALELVSALLLALAAGLILLLLWVALEALFYFSPVPRTGLGLGAAGTTIGIVSFYLRRRLPPYLAFERLGLHIEECYPKLQQRLISTLELWQNARAHRLYSVGLLTATVARTAALLDELNPRQITDLRPLMTHVRGLAMVVVLILGAYALFDSSMAAALKRCAHPLTHFEREALTHIAVLPGDFEVVKAEDALIEIHFSGVHPRTAQILRREDASAPWHREEIIVERSATLGHTFKQVKRPFTYRVVANDGHSRIYRVTVVDPPSIQRLRVHYNYPAYSGLASRVEEEGGDISGLAGTVVKFEISASKALSAAKLVVDDTLSYPARVEGNKAFAGLEIAIPGHYHFELTDQKGVGNRDPIRYAIQVVEDLAPRVAITDPGRDMDLPENLQVILAAEATDDFGIARAVLAYRVNEGQELRQELQFESDRELHLTHLWDLSTRDLLPEDRVHYRLDVFDNDEIAGPKVGKSQEYVLRFPSLYELYEEVTTAQESQLEALEELAEEGEKNQEYLEQVRRELLKTNELSWEQKKELEATLAREAERAEAVEELAQQLEETLQEIEENQLAPREILDKMEEIRKLMAEVTSPELQEALDALKEASESLDPAEIAEALKQFKEDQEAFQERLDRTLALLQQVQTEQRLEAAVQQAAELERRQGQIDAELEREGISERLQAQESSLQRDTERLQQELQALSQEMEDFNQETAQALEGQADFIEERALTSRMSEMLKHLQQERRQKARRLGESLEKDLGTLSAAMEHLQGQYSAKEKGQLAREMQQTIRDILYLSLQQEILGGKAQNIQRPAAAALAQDQFALLQGATLVTEKIGRLSRKTMSLDPGLGMTLGYVLRNMQEAAYHLGQRNASAAVAPQRSSTGYLNEAILLLRQSLDNLAKSKMPSSFAEAMQQMIGLSEQQADLNQATQEAMGQGRQPGQRGRQVRDMATEMARLAAQQRQIYEALNQLERATRGHRGAQKRIQAIEEDMESVLRELPRRPNKRTLNTQKRILQRMLNASRSIHTQGYQEKRLATSGSDQMYTGQTWMPTDLGQSYDRLREAMKHALEGPYPDEYRPLIQRYYEMVYQDLIEREEKAKP